MGNKLGLLCQVWSLQELFQVCSLQETLRTNEESPHKRLTEIMALEEHKESIIYHTMYVPLYERKY